MILGIGIDIVHADRLKRWKDTPGLLERYFHPKELITASSRGAGEILSLAARFAAKEAFGKALGTGLSGITLKNIIVLNNHNGKPYINLNGDALEVFNKLGGKTIHLSLTHERDNAMANVIIEGGD